MKNVKIFESIGAGWTLFMKRPWYLLGLTLATLGLFVAASSSGAMITALSYIVFGGYFVLLFKHYNGVVLIFDDIFTIDQRWVYFAFLSVIKALFIILGFLFFIIPGIYLSIRWMFAEFYVIDKGMRPLEALKASSALTYGHKWKLFLFALVSGLLVILGLLFFVVGAVVMLIVTWFASIKIYKELQAQESSTATVV